jgi:hypothetical protein
MAIDPIASQGAVIQAQLSNNQQLADGLPSYKIYKNPAGSPNMAGPRALGSAAYYREINTPQGTIAGSSWEPTPSPQEAAVGRQPFVVSGQLQGMQQPTPFTPPAIKLMVEPSTYVPGTGWINSAKPNG